MQVKSIAECSPLEHSAILLTCMKLTPVFKTFVLSILKHSAVLLTCMRLTPVFKTFVLSIFVLFIFEWPLKTGFTAFSFLFQHSLIMMHTASKLLNIKR